MLTALISPPNWAGVKCAPGAVSVLACASMCSAQHYPLLFGQRRLINRRAEMHLNWFIWLVLDVLFFFFFLVGDNLCRSMGGGGVESSCLVLFLYVCVCVCMCWLMDAPSVKPWKHFPNKWIYWRPHQLLLISAGSISFLQWRRGVQGERLDTSLSLLWRFTLKLVPNERYRLARKSGNKDATVNSSCTIRHVHGDFTAIIIVKVHLKWKKQSF